MEQNKSVEEVVKYAEFLCSPDAENMPEYTRINNLIVVTQKLIDLLQTSQEREREIVLEAIRLSDEAERGNETEFNEWRAFKGFRNGLRDWAKEKGITNPNKD